MGLFSFNIATELCFVHRKINTACVDSTAETFKTDFSWDLLLKMTSRLHLHGVRNVVLLGLIIRLNFTLPSVVFVFLPFFGALFFVIPLYLWDFTRRLRTDEP